MLGAGATKGSLAPGGRQCDPPLNADFFTQLQRITRPKHRDTVRKVIEDVVDIYGADFSLTLEEYFTHLESFAATVRRTDKTHPKYTAEFVNARRARLMKALAAVLEESTDVSKADAEVCDHHAALVQALEAQDTVISFNYDCVMDHALRSTASGKWNAQYGYTFRTPKRVSGHEHWSAPDPPKAIRDTIYLIKLHGSLNWQLPSGDGALTDEINLKSRLYQQRGTPRFTIIPPENQKDVEYGNFKFLWSNAERAIRNAKTIALVGFSFTPTDLHVDSLFRFALAGGNLETLVIVNPNRDHRQRVRHVFSKELAGGAIVRQYDGMAQFADSIPDALS